jgi:RHS repeat-associated protein
VTPAGGGAATMQYFVADSLGSTAVLTDGSGTVTERDSYDAWGRRRNTDGTDNSACSITSATTRGYTGHEELDSVCQINANARIYDPTLGRFMSADMLVQNPFGSQSYNRYSYVENGPLSATDPTGHVTEIVIVTPTLPKDGGMSGNDTVGGAGGGGEQTNGEDAPDYPVSAGQPTPVVVVVAHPPTPALTPVTPNDAAIRTFNIPYPHCSASWMAFGNFLRKGANDGAWVGTGMEGAGFLTMGVSAMGAPETLGMSELPGYSLFEAGAYVNTISAGADLWSSQDSVDT